MVRPDTAVTGVASRATADRENIEARAVAILTGARRVAAERTGGTQSFNTRVTGVDEAATRRVNGFFDQLVEGSLSSQGIERAVTTALANVEAQKAAAKEAEEAEKSERVVVITKPGRMVRRNKDKIDA